MRSREPLPRQEGRRARDRVAVAPERARRRHQPARARRCCAWRPTRSSGSPRGLADGVVLVSATNGKTTTSALVAAALGPEHALCRNGAGANLLSGVASALLTAPSGAQLGLFEVDEFALPEIALRTRPRALLLSNLFRDQLDRYGELELVAERWRGDGRPACRRRRCSCWRADDPVISSLGDGRANVIRYGLDDPAVALTSLADVRRLDHVRPVRARLRLRGDLPRPPRRLPLPELRPRPAAARRGGARRSSCAASTAAASRSAGRGSSSALPGIYNVYNARAARSPSPRRSASSPRWPRSASAARGRRSAGSSGSSSATATPCSCS